MIIVGLAWLGLRLYLSNTHPLGDLSSLKLFCWFVFFFRFLML